MNEVTFTPRVIGLPDTEKERAIVRNYTEICDNATSLLALFDWFLSGEDDINVFFEFLKSSNPTHFLYSRFIEINQISFPGLSIDKIIELALVDVPVDDFKELISQRKRLLESISKANAHGFYFPLIKLFHCENNDPATRGFDISQNFQWIATPEFDAALYNYVRKFTASEKENEVLEAIETAISGLNGLFEIGLIRKYKQRWVVDFDNFTRAIEFNANSETPLTIHPMLPKFKGFTRFFESRGFTLKYSKPEDILRFGEVEQIQNEIAQPSNPVEDPDKDQFADKSENLIVAE